MTTIGSRAARPGIGSRTQASSSDCPIAEAGRKAGICSLRPQQIDCVQMVLEGNDVLAVIPTGGGKSAIYQVAGQLVEGPVVVVTPLLALAQDQLDSLSATELSPGARIDGNTKPDQRDAILADLASGTTKFCFVTPETLCNPSISAQLAGVEVSLLVVDEAHCAVTWGHSFRSDYLEMATIRRALGDPVCLALTASADPRLRGDIGRLLGLVEPYVSVDSLLRPNLDLAVESCPDRSSAHQQLLRHVSQSNSKTIVYVPTCALADQLASELAELAGDCAGRARPFHGRLKASVRSETIEWFRTTEAGVVVATTAFGMGIDIADVDEVVHLDLPPTLIDYYQEVGRAGRDGRLALATAFVGMAKRSRRSFAGGVRAVAPAHCRRVLSAMAAGHRSLKALGAATELKRGPMMRALTVLELAGAVQRRPRLALVDAEVSDARLEELCALREEFDRSQRAAIDRFKSSRSCRWGEVLAALGEASTPCNRCDNCLAHGDVGDDWTGVRVLHKSFGRGTITGFADGVATVTFDQAGPKSLDLDLCLTQQLVHIDLTDIGGFGSEAGGSDTQETGIQQADIQEADVANA